MVSATAKLREILHLARASRRFSESGAVLVEGVLAFSLFIIPFVFGVLDYTMYANAVGNIKEIAAEAARNDAASFSTFDPANGSISESEFIKQLRLADYRGLDTVRQLLSNGDMNNLDRVVIYDASKTDGSVPSECLATVSWNSPSISGLCNVYSRDFIQNMTQNSFLASSNHADDSWPSVVGNSSNRNIGVDEADRIGVAVIVRHNMLTGFFGASKTITASEVHRHGPQPLSYTHPTTDITATTVSPSVPTSVGNGGTTPTTKGPGGPNTTTNVTTKATTKPKTVTTWHT